MIGTIVICITLISGMLAAFWMGSRVAQGKDVLPPPPGKLQIIEPEEPPDRYGSIWPKDKVYSDTEENS